MQSYAQYKEDLKILDIFKDVPGFFVDVGFNDGIEASNTYLLEQHNWEMDDNAKALEKHNKNI